MQKKILLTGGTGFLGSCIAKKMLDQGFLVFLLKRKKSDLHRIGNLLENKNLIILDREKNKELDRIFKDGIDFVVHVATSYGRDGEPATEIIKANLIFPLELLELAVKHKVPGFMNADTFFNENIGLSDRELLYVKTKKDFLNIAKNIIKGSDIKLANLKIEQMYGPDDNPKKFIPFVIRNLLSDKDINLTKGEQKRDFVFVDDVADAFLSVADNFEKIGQFDEFGIGAGRSFPIKKVVAKLKKELASDSHLAWGALPYRENEMMDSRADILNNKKIKWKPLHGLDCGLELTADFYRSNHE